MRLPLRFLLPWLGAAGAGGLAAWLLLQPADAQPAPLAAPAPAPSRAAPPTPLSARAAPPALAAADEDLSPPPEERGYPVDLGALRAALPDNLYWSTGVPTGDPVELEARAQRARRWEALHARVLATEASEEDIRSYYAYKRQLSEDSITFALRVLDDYGDQLPERDQGLLALSVRMHRARLEDLPKEEREALARLLGEGRADQLRNEAAHQPTR